jgi:hypothetical protein
MKVDGGCLCGQVTYEAEIDPERVAICHCTQCQTHSATAFGVVAPIVEGKFTLLTGTLKTYVKTADSGARREQAFCPECGTRIHTRTVGGGPGLFGLRVGTINQRAELTPKVQIWHRSALPWLGELRDIPTVPTQPNLSK